MIRCFTAAIAVAVAIITLPAHAGTLALDLNVTSVHTQAWARQGLNQRNPGVGLTYHADRTWAIAAGIYRNSYRRATVYALGQWTPLHVGRADGWHADAGLAAGIATGYRRDEVPCAPCAAAGLLRIVAPSGIGVVLVGVPNSGQHNSGFVGVQVFLPIAWR